ncbi:MAG: 50S ribosomal protein L13 [Candidatus Paceibacterota bacterium]
MIKKDIKTIDADGKTLGRVSTEIATSLMGKNSVNFQRHIYSGFPVKVINAKKLKITIKKLEQTVHANYSGHRGGLRMVKAIETVEKKGMKELIKNAVYQMLPDNKLRREMMKHLIIND